VYETFDVMWRGADGVVVPIPIRPDALIIMRRELLVMIAKSFDVIVPIRLALVPVALAPLWI
jgi:hypothetical protein